MQRMRTRRTGAGARRRGPVQVHLPQVRREDRLCQPVRAGRRCRRRRAAQRRRREGAGGLRRLRGEDAGGDGAGPEHVTLRLRALLREEPLRQPLRRGRRRRRRPSHGDVADVADRDVGALQRGVWRLRAVLRRPRAARRRPMPGEVPALWPGSAHKADSSPGLVSVRLYDPSFAPLGHHPRWWRLERRHVALRLVRPDHLHKRSRRCQGRALPCDVPLWSGYRVVHRPLQKRVGGCARRVPRVLERDGRGREGLQGGDSGDQGCGAAHAR
mmetsp:Transcript_10835/g.31320  ORF Transcript_10835/g.31320 Transcript_10835/m.31320 type:complete len:271 (-) Transcript_10835:888-1700(-)